MQRWIDTNLRREVASEDTLYFYSGETIKKMSLSFTGLVANVYWIRTIQYFGNKLINAPEDTKRVADIRMDLLAPYLDIAVTLDPHNIPAYHFGAMFLPERDVEAAIKLLNKGIEQNPDEWRLYQDIGFIYWQMQDFEKAAEYYDRGSQIEGARWWMRDLAGVMRIRGGSREVARTIYLSYLENEEPRIREQAEVRLIQLRSLDEIDAINIFLNRLKDQQGTCQDKLRSLAPRLRQLGIAMNEKLMPVDPKGFTYEIDTSSCQVRLSNESTVAR
jgi:tetratricopeptide (TPR) repeat protein